MEHFFVSWRARPCNGNGCLFVSLAVLVFVIIHPTGGEVTNSEKRELKTKVVEMFNHAYGSYMKYAYPADELMPLSCKGRYRGSEPDRGDIDESLGNFSLTLIDTLDTLAVIGNISEFDRAVKLVINNVQFDADLIVSVFETNIRVLGGLLGGHVVSELFKENHQGMQWYQGELLDMAVDIADRLLVAFNTTTGIPYPRINLRYGVHHPMSRLFDERDTCTACAGTMIMEFAALSRLTRNPIYEEKAHRAMNAIWHYRSRSSDLVGTVINVHNGDWTRRDSGIGAGIDSYYEYCFKAYILLGDKTYLEKFNKHYAAINKYIKQGAMMLDVLMHQPDRPIRSFVDSLQAFWPGLQVLMGDLKPAIETHEMLYEVAKRHKFIPEAFTTNYEVYWAQHPLRPEFAESTYFLYEATKDPYYLEAGRHIVETLELHARVPCGFAAIQDLRTFAHEDKMDSFVLAETFKYLYLLFSEESERVLDIHNFVFTTEAHLLPLSLSNVIFESKGNQTKQNATKEQSDTTVSNDLPSTCPNNAMNKHSIKEFARIIRKEYRRPQQQQQPDRLQCNSDNIEQKFKDAYLNADPNREPKLRAEHFQVGNADHLLLLKDMGITVVQTADGKVQLMHQAGTAATPEDATDGIKFMQQMIQVAKTKAPEHSMVHKPRFVQLTSPPFNGKPFLRAGAAQFGIDISNQIGVTAEVIESNPYNACSEITNNEDFMHRIVIAERGSCMFIDKVRRAQALGALGVIIVDHNEGTSEEAQPIFAMSGDAHSEDVSIPSVFLFRKEGDLVRYYAKEAVEKYGRYLTVRIAGKIDENNVQESDSTSEKEETSVEKEETSVEKEETSVENQDGQNQRDTDGIKVPETASKQTIHSSSQEETLFHTKLDPKICKQEAKTADDELLFAQQKLDKDGIKGVVVKTKIESHVGRNADGEMVEFITTYSRFKGSSQTASETTSIHVSTKEFPLPRTSLEIEGETLERSKISESTLQSKDEITSDTDALKESLKSAVEDDSIGQKIGSIDSLKQVSQDTGFSKKVGVGAPEESSGASTENQDEASEVAPEKDPESRPDNHVTPKESSETTPEHPPTHEGPGATSEHNVTPKIVAKATLEDDTIATTDQNELVTPEENRDIVPQEGAATISDQSSSVIPEKESRITSLQGEKFVPDEAQKASPEKDPKETQQASIISPEQVGKATQGKDGTATTPQQPEKARLHKDTLENSNVAGKFNGDIIDINPASTTLPDQTSVGPKNIICNSAGCFSSLEELQMFRGLAEEAKINFFNPEAEEASTDAKQASKSEPIQDIVSSESNGSKR